MRLMTAGEYPASCCFLSARPFGSLATSLRFLPALAINRPLAHARRLQRINPSKAAFCSNPAFSQQERLRVFCAHRLALAYSYVFDRPACCAHRCSSRLIADHCVALLMSVDCGSLRLNAIMLPVPRKALAAFQRLRCAFRLATSGHARQRARCAKAHKEIAYHGRLAELPAFWFNLLIAMENKTLDRFYTLAVFFI